MSEAMQVTITVELPNLGSQIKKAREERGLSPTWVAAQAGMSTAHLYRIEGEEIKSLPRETLRNLSRAIGVDFESALQAVVRTAFSGEVEPKTA